MTEDEIIVESTFEVDATPDEAWTALEELTAAHSAGPDEWWLPGFASRATEVDAVRGQRLEVVKAEQPCKGTTIVLTIEHLATGSRIHVVQSGFDPSFVELAGDDFWNHGRQILADLEQFFRTGVIAERA